MYVLRSAFHKTSARMQNTGLCLGLCYMFRALRTEAGGTVDLPHMCTPRPPSCYVLCLGSYPAEAGGTADLPRVYATPIFMLYIHV
jgi:hypothetical protein